MITVCPHCQKKLKVEDHLAGVERRCPVCRETFTVRRVPGDAGETPKKAPGGGPASVRPSVGGAGPSPSTGHSPEAQALAHAVRQAGHPRPGPPPLPRQVSALPPGTSPPGLMAEVMFSLTSPSIKNYGARLGFIWGVLYLLGAVLPMVISVPDRGGAHYELIFPNIE